MRRVLSTPDSSTVFAQAPDGWREKKNPGRKVMLPMLQLDVTAVENPMLSQEPKLAS